MSRRLPFKKRSLSSGNNHGGTAERHEALDGSEHEGGGPPIRLALLASDERTPHGQIWDYEYMFPTGMIETRLATRTEVEATG